MVCSQGLQYEFQTVQAIYKDKTILRSTPDCNLTMDCDNVRYSIRIQQCNSRIITVHANKPVYWNALLEPLYDLERLLMIFDGVFITLQNIDFYDSLNDYHHDLKQLIKNQTIKQRLAYFDSDKICSIRDKLVDFSEVLNDDLLIRWKNLVEELDIANQVYLYNMADTGMPVDLRLAFIIELAEPLLEIVKAEKHIYPALKPGDKGTSLKQCLKALIDTYGKIIFVNEISTDYDGFLSKMIESRVRIMHIKNHQQPDNYFDGKYSVAYIRKLSFLYRIIVLDLLKIKEGKYKGRLIKRTEAIDEWMEGWK